MADQNEFSWKTKGNVNIYAYRWDVEDAKAVICLVHGLGEHLHRYDHMVAYYNEYGYSVMSFDNIGHGKSGGKRGHLPSFQVYMDNVSILLETAEKAYPLLPRFLYGHSMGGNIVLNYALRNNPSIAGLVSSAAWITLEKSPPALLIAVANVLKYIAPSLQQPSDLDPTAISRDEAEVKKYMADPLVHGKISINFGAEMLPAAKWLETYEGPAKVPFLLMHGSADKLTSPEGSVLLAKNLTGDVTHKSWEGLYHEIHNEPEQKEVFDYTINWLEEKIEKWSDDTKED